MRKSKNECPICNRKKSHSEKYDADFCKHCNIWLEPVCGNRNCEFCATRPRNPVKNQFADLMTNIQDFSKLDQGKVVLKRKIMPVRQNK